MDSPKFAQVGVRLRRFFEDAASGFDGLGFCLSSERDQLSQWRGYADDGRGVALGFDAKKLSEFIENYESIPTKPQLFRVWYEEQEHDDAVEPIVHDLASLLNLIDPPRGAMPDRRSEQERNASPVEVKAARWSAALKQRALIDNLFRLKPKAFQEEKEWRIVSTVHEEHQLHRDYRVRDSKIVPYRQIKFGPPELMPLRSVCLGPKHPTPDEVVASMLKSMGHSGVVVERSAASYR